MPTHNDNVADGDDIVDMQVGATNIARGRTQIGAQIGIQVGGDGPTAAAARAMAARLAEAARWFPAPGAADFQSTNIVTGNARVGRQMDVHYGDLTVEFGSDRGDG